VVRGEERRSAFGELSSQTVHEQALASLKIKESVDAGVGRIKAVIIEGG